MAIQEGIDAIRNHIAKAQFERDTSRAAGLEDRYLLAHFMVVAMELELGERVRQQDAMPFGEDRRENDH